MSTNNSTMSEQKDPKPPTAGAANPATIINHSDSATSEKGEPKHPTAGAANSAVWRKRKALKDKELLDVYNATRIEKKLNPVSLTPVKSHALKGKPRPKYDPPPEIAAKMDGKQLSAWRQKERLKRKAAQQAENRAKKKAMLEEIKAEMPDFVSQVEATMTRNTKYVYNPPPEELKKMNKTQLSEWRANERRKRNTVKQREIRARKREEKMNGKGTEETKPNVQEGKKKSAEDPTDVKTKELVNNSSIEVANILLSHRMESKVKDSNLEVDEKAKSDVGEGKLKTVQCPSYSETNVDLGVWKRWKSAVGIKREQDPATNTDAQSLQPQTMLSKVKECGGKVTEDTKPDKRKKKKEAHSSPDAETVTVSVTRDELEAWKRWKRSKSGKQALQEQRKEGLQQDSVNKNEDRKKKEFNAVEVLLMLRNNSSL